METVGVLAGLTLFGGLDAMFAGFRASCGRTGLVEHRHADRAAFARGLVLGVPLLAPVAIAVLTDAGLNDRRGVYLSAGKAMLAFYAPYGLVVLIALAAYGTLHWRQRFLASAILLGPLTLIRPLVALAGALSAAVVTADLRCSLFAFASVVGVLAVEPLAGRLWYSAAPTWAARRPS